MYDKKKFGPVSVDDIKKFSATMTKYYDENKDVFNLVDKWEEITGLTLEELDELELDEVVEIIREKIKSGSIELEIEQLSSILPKSFIMPNNKLANKLPEGAVVYGENEILVNKDKGISTKVTLNYDDENIHIVEKDKRFTPYDRNVHDAVCSLYEAGNNNFTPDQVYRCMNGLDDQQYVSEQAIEAITNSLDKARRILAKVDFTNEAKAYRKNTEKFIIEDHILPAKKVTLKAGGKEVVGYKLNSKPVLYQYAQVSGQVLTVPSKLLNTKDVIKSTSEVIVMRAYLIRRIEVMKHNKNKIKSNRILLENIYNEIGVPEPNKDKSKKVRNAVGLLLDKFKEEKYIKGYEFYKEGRTIVGIKINY